MLTAERLREALDYNPLTGEFRWLVTLSNRAPAGKLAGTIEPRDGYRKISVDGVDYRAGRLAFLWMTGQWPDPEVDHINRVAGDDRWENLREATRSQNNGNVGRRSHNTSGLKGVFASSSKKNPWCARIFIKKCARYLGTFRTQEEAHAAYMAAAVAHFGDFANSGLPAEALTRRRAS